MCASNTETRTIFPRMDFKITRGNKRWMIHFIDYSKELGFDIKKDGKLLRMFAFGKR